MSAIVKTTTPFIDQQILLHALDVLGFPYTVHGQEIVTQRVDYYGFQKFIWSQGQYLFQHDSSAESVQYPYRNLNVKEYKTVGSFLEAVEKAYNAEYNRLLEEAERARQEELERQRQAFVQQQKQTIIQKAREQGYEVKEKIVGTKVQLVMVKHTY